MIGIVALLVADVFCLATVYKLRKEINNAILPIISNTNGDSSRAYEPPNPIRFTIKLRQKQAVYSVFFILLVFSLSQIPILVQPFCPEISLETF